MIQIKDMGKQPATMKLKFNGTYPYSAPMSPEEHTIKAINFIDLFVKLNRFFSKFGYEIK